MSFHVVWHRAPAAVGEGPTWSGPYGSLPTMHVPNSALYLPWEISFEQAVAALELLPGMFCEGDGAWIWHPARDRQIEGVLFDRAERLAYVELKGNCAGQDIDRLAIALNPNRREIVVQLPREGLLLSWDTWRCAWFDAARPG
jgi:hypothetical protein